MDDCKKFDADDDTEMSEDSDYEKIQQSLSKKRKKSSRRDDPTKRKKPADSTEDFISKMSKDRSEKLVNRAKICCLCQLGENDSNLVSFSFSLLYIYIYFFLVILLLVF